MKHDSIEDGDLGARLESARSRLRRMVELRMNPALRGRLEPSDVIQESCIEVTRRFPDYRREPKLPFYVWARRVTADTLHDLERRHLGARMRDARREVRTEELGVSSLSLSGALLRAESPSKATARREEIARLREALDRLRFEEREALALRHFEQASNEEVARVLSVSESTASRYYMRALRSVRALIDGERGRELDG